MSIYSTGTLKVAIRPLNAQKILPPLEIRFSASMCAVLAEHLRNDCLMPPEQNHQAQNTAAAPANSAPPAPEQASPAPAATVIDAEVASANPDNTADSIATATATVELSAALREAEARATEAEARATEHQDAWLRARAEAENIRRRAQEDVAKASKFAAEKFAGAMLPVKDSLEAALATENQTLEKLREGVELTLKQLGSAFESANLREENPLQQKFDPNKHQAIGALEADAEPNTVIQVLQKGYLLHDRVIRPAMVMVAKARTAPPAPNPVPNPSPPPNSGVKT
jgi:molecular chaperone GrpE